MPPAALKLKETLATNIPMTLTMKKRGPSYPETDYNTREPTGKKIFLYVFTNPEGQEVKHYANEREQENLSLFQPGEKLQVVRQEAMKDDKRIAFLVWTGAEGAEARAAATPQVQTNTAIATQHKKAEEYKDAETEKWDRIALSKIVHEFQKTAYAMGKSIVECSIDAKALTREQYKIVEELWNERNS